MKFKIGDKVKVVRIIEEGEERLGEIGYIINMLTGYYATPDNPLYYIKFNKGKDHFWGEEIEKC